MAPKAKHPKPHPPRPVRSTQSSNPHDRRNGLLPYILDPSSFPPSTVIRHTEHTVLIRDQFPKATVHLLLLPRDLTKSILHPHQAFSDSGFLHLMRSEAAVAVRLAASELSRLIGPCSKSSQARLEAMESVDPPDPLPAGRDFSRDLRVGVHAHPSMNHLHIHIISRDMHSDWLKHRKHYNSFNTDFFLPLADFPLAEDDERQDVRYQNANLKKDLQCWRCGKNFGNKFKELKDHLEVEFEEWRKE